MPSPLDADALAALPPRRPDVALLLSHPAHLIALGAGSGLSPKAPGTVGTLWAWVSFWALQSVWGVGPQADVKWACLIGVGLPVGWWACTHTARSLRVADPGAIVWDEILAFWLVLWLLTPTGFIGQLLAFALFRYFDAAKPGPVAWADRLFKRQPGQGIGWAQGFGILFDDFVAALCTLLVLAGVMLIRPNWLAP
ncbi:phosphatidylglycerophosphatase A [Aquabacterium sp. CECT 9606]|uniref:phosphatidylglycerophosphatase A family protein n=1 Tax=Aquabacterium sp. CECT 9606 TaxID=2845822 RepID=UPI001E62046B|nr:phosphatidylglycerophosphatase A [Aquabacterium sp. CECT 9606]CAH0350819.1 Phosphatidylglycerophosphatase A [Aquabacterium sp. CECT 9606]